MLPGVLVSGDLLDEIFIASPEATIMVAKIFQSRIPKIQARITFYDDAIPGIVAQRAKQGQHVVIVDFSSIGDDLFHTDGIRPTDASRKEMAEIWLVDKDCYRQRLGGRTPNWPGQKSVILEANTSTQKCLTSRDGVLNARNGHIFGTTIFFCQSRTRGGDYLTV